MQTLGDYLPTWAADLASRGEIRRSTAMSYETSVRVHLVPRLGKVQLQQLTRGDIKAAYEQLRIGGRARGARGGLSAKTVHNVHLCLHRALNDALDEGLVKSNAANGAHKLSTDRPEMVCWSADELRRFLDLVSADERYPLWRLAASTGMRRGELLGLRWRDVDLDRARLQVSQQLARGGPSAAFGPPKTRAGRRNIALDPTTVEALRAQLRAQAPNRLAVGAAYRNDLDLVFTRVDGSPLDPDVVSQQFDRWVSKSGAKRITLHGLRHTHATLGLQAGVHPEVMRERLGHSSIAVTLDLYSHAIPAMQEDAAARIAAVVDGIRG